MPCGEYARPRGGESERASLRVFERVDTVRKTRLQRAGRLARPSGKLTLTISGAGGVKEKLLGMLDRLRSVAGGIGHAFMQRWGLRCDFSGVGACFRRADRRPRGCTLGVWPAHLR